MHIGMITPAPPRSLSGNRASATRWAGFLRDAGHRVTIATDYDDADYDLLIALHAWRSAAAVEHFASLYPEKPLIVVLTGTDLYRFMLSHPETTLRSIELADRLVVLHDLAYLVIPESSRQKIEVICQSALPLKRRLSPAKRSFDICVVGHLREEKDPLRAAYAVRNLPQSSRIRILHYGKAHDDAWAHKARDEMVRNPRYKWLGERPHWQARQAYARCRAMVLSSVMEGGANVISEATVAGLPVIASDIQGSIGLLGRDYVGYYAVENTEALRACLLRAESEPGYLQRLHHQCDTQAQRFTPAQESAAWQRLVKSVS
jgi:putative glycosyltransferase (TIGR04348 family)